MASNLITINIKGIQSGDIKVIPNNIQEIRVIEVGPKYKVQVTVVSGRSYYLADNNVDTFDTKTEAQQIAEDFSLEVGEKAGSDQVDLTDYYTKTEIDNIVEDVESALDTILGV